MNIRSGAWLLFLAVVPGVAFGQPDPPRTKAGNTPKKIHWWPPSQSEDPSHRLLELKGLDSSEAALMKRLQGWKRVQQDDQKVQLNKEMVDLARRLLENPAFRKSLEKQMGSEGMRQWQQRVEKGAPLASDPLLHKLLKDEVLRRNLSPRDEDLVRRWSEANPAPPERSRPNIGDPEPARDPEKNPSPPPPVPPPPSVPPPPPPVVPPQQPAENPQPGPTPGDSEWMKDRLDKWTESLEEWLESPSGKQWRETIQDMGRRWGDDSRFFERMRGWSGRLPSIDRSMGRWLEKTSANLPSWRPSAPNISMPGTGSWPSLSSGGGSGGALGLLALGALLVVFLLLARKGLGVWEGTGGGGAWRLGPWPVAPQSVATRDDLVRAFEHLALLCLGRSALTYHHLEVAEQLGQQPAADPSRRREAAEFLARLYERARYAPAEETIRADEMAAARRDLCYLAGVSTS
jgi:hypothetical protein